MTVPNNENLYSTWDDHWAIEPKLTLPGRIMTAKRLKALSTVISSLEIRSAIDVGCGLGFTLELLNRFNLAYIGIDVAPKAVEYCRSKDLNVKLGKLEDEKDRYDLVISEGMLEHFLNFEPYVEHMIRISKRYVLLMQPNHDSITGKTLVYLAQIIRGDRIVFEYNYRMQDYIMIFRRHGCDLLLNRPVFGDTSRILLFQRNRV